MKLIKFFSILLCGLFLQPANAKTPQSAITVFAAASLTQVMQTLGDVYMQKSGQRLQFSFAASSTLARQIEAGATAQVFVSADGEWVDYLEAHRLTLQNTRRNLVGNRLVLVTTSPMMVNLAKGWPEELSGPIALGDPAHVPAGRYAKQALTHLGLYAQLEKRIVTASSVRDALAWVERGEAKCGVVYETDARVSSKVHVAATFPEDSHSPIIYTAALTPNGDAGQEFLDFLSSPQAIKIWRDQGFLITQ